MVLGWRQKCDRYQVWKRKFFLNESVGVENHSNSAKINCNLIFEPTCASCTMGSYASLSVCLSVWVYSGYIIHHLYTTTTVYGVLVHHEGAISLHPLGSFYLSMLVICGNLRVGSMSTSSCIFEHLKTS